MPYGVPKELAKEIKKLPALPDCFVAANDTIAISLLDALKSLKIRVPKDIKTSC